VNFQGKEACVNSLLTAHFSQNEHTALSAISVVLAGVAQDMRTSQAAGQVDNLAPLKTDIL